jgi:hypothetical protein
MKQPEYPDGWDAERVRRVLEHYEAQSDEAARHPELAREFVQAVVVFTEPRCELQISRPAVAVVRFSQLLAHVVELGQARRMDRALAHIAARSLTDGAR